MILSWKRQGGGASRVGAALGAAAVGPYSTICYYCLTLPYQSGDFIFVTVFLLPLYTSFCFQNIARKAFIYLFVDLFFNCQESFFVVNL